MVSHDRATVAHDRPTATHDGASTRVERQEADVLKTRKLSGDVAKPG